MFSIGKKSINSSMTTIYIFLFILVVNQFLIVHSFRLMHEESDQSEPEDGRRAVIRRLAFENVPNIEDILNDKQLQLLAEPTVQRRFCCMSPLSGRKRSVRDLARKQIKNHQA